MKYRNIFGLIPLTLLPAALLMYFGSIETMEGYSLIEVGQFASGYLAAGNFSLGILSAGIFAAGVFSV